VLGGGGCVAADGVLVAGGFLRAEPTGDLLLGLRWPQVALVGGGRDGGVSEEPQYVGFAVAQAFQQRTGGRLLALGAGDAADLEQPDGDAAAEQRQALRGHLPGNRAHAAVAGHVGGVDEAAQRVCDLAGPDRLRVALGGVLKIPEQVVKCRYRRNNHYPDTVVMPICRRPPLVAGVTGLAVSA
jgi:hypothetical protein